MSSCEYCGEKTGWFQSSHPACIAKADSTAQAVKEFVIATVSSGTLAEILAGVSKILDDTHVKEQYVHEALMDALDEAASQVAMNSPVSDDDYDRIESILFAYAKPWAQPGLERFGLGRLMQSNLIWRVINNLTPVWNEPPQFNLQQDETLVYQTGADVTYAEERTVSTHNRSYGGLSVPVGLGMYAHLGGSHGHQESGLLTLDGGMVAITTHNFYFAGQKATLQIPLQRVIRYQSYADGVGICEAYGAPKLFLFNHDSEFLSGTSGYDMGWFLHPFLTALTQRLS